MQAKKRAENRTETKKGIYERTHIYKKEAKLIYCLDRRLYKISNILE